MTQTTRLGTTELGATGLEIKEDAIAQGVQIELDFILSVELPDGRHRVVGNDQTITVHKGQAFTAVPDDDNS